jgi:DNA-binding NarL/FixJ family response regulator
MSALSGREREVLRLLAAGLSNAGIAAELVRSDRTIDAHLRSIFGKLELPDSRHDNRRVQAAAIWASESNVVSHLANVHEMKV